MEMMEIEVEHESTTNHNEPIDIKETMIDQRDTSPLTATANEDEDEGDDDKGDDDGDVGNVSETKKQEESTKETKNVSFEPVPKETGENTSVSRPTP